MDVLTNEKAARICQAAIRELQRERWGFRQPAWNGLRKWQHECLAEMVRQARFGATPEQLHACWCEFFTLHGWTYHEEWNLQKPTHPWLRPWCELAHDEQAVYQMMQMMVVHMTLDFSGV